MTSPVLQFKRGLFVNLPGLRAGEPGFTTDTYDLYVGLTSETSTNKFFGSHRYWRREDGTNALRFNLVDKDGSNYVAIKAPNTLAGIVTYTLPGTQGAVSSVLTNDGSGNLTWASGSANPVFSGIATFTDTTDNTLGDVNTGAVQIDGGVGIAKNVTVGAGLSVAGESYFIGTATFYGGQINLGDSDGDNISVAGEFVSNLVPNATNTYDLGLTGKRWRDGYFSRNLDVTGNLTVDGNVTIGGTTVTLLGQDVYIQNKDIILGYTTSITNADISTDDSANHAGVAIASTVGTPLASFSASGINTLPDTYKQLMWFKQGTLGFGTDAFAFNYGVAIGTTNMATGVRLAVGTGVTVGDTSVTAINFYGNASTANQVKTVTAGDANATYHITFVDSNNGSASNETVYTDDGIYYNPGTNTFTTQNASFTGNVTVSGTLTGTATTATRATLVDTTGTSTNADYYVTFVDTLAGENSETLRVGVGLSVNPSTGEVKTAGRLSVGDPGALTSYIKAGGGSDALYLYANGDVSFQQKVIVGGLRSSSNSNNTLTLNDLDASFARNLVIAGVTTVGTGVGITQFSGSVSTGNSTSSVPTSSAIIEYVRNADFGIVGDTGSGSVNMDHTFTISGTANEIETSASGQTITIGLPDAVVVGTSLSAPTLRTGTIQSSNTGATAITIAANDVTIADDLTVGGNLYVNGNTTQVNTTSMTVEDRTVELGVVDGSAPSTSTTWDLGVLFNYYTDAAKKSAVIWEHGDSRFKFASILGADSNGTNANTPQLTVNTFAPIEVGSLWITDCAGTSQVISCTGSTRYLENITVDAGTF